MTKRKIVRGGLDVKYIEFDEYDTDKLKAARRLLEEVYEYNYFPSRPLIKRLGTIIEKLDTLMKLNKEERD